MVEIVGPGEHGALQSFARGISQYNAAEINRVARCHTREIKPRLGYSFGENVVHRDDLALVRELDLTTGDL